MFFFHSTQFLLYNVKLNLKKAFQNIFHIPSKITLYKVMVVPHFEKG
jgi:hypothetical protein